MPVVNAISFLGANRHCNKSSPQATKSRAQTIASTPQTGSTVLQQAGSTARQQPTASSAPLPLDSTPAGCLGRLSPQPVSQSGRQEARGRARTHGSMWQQHACSNVWRVTGRLTRRKQRSVGRDPSVRRGGLSSKFRSR